LPPNHTSLPPEGRHRGTDENTGVAITGITADSVTVEQVSRLSWAVIAGIAVGSVAVAVGIFFAIRKWVWKKGVPG
jgi:hypothetical protein